MIGTFARLRDPRIAVPLLLCIGTLERLGWAWKRGIDGGGGEAQWVALALASGRGFADPYFVGSGPTAHLMPTTPLLAGGVHALAGPTAAEVILQILASAEMVAGYLLLLALAARVGVSSAARLAAFAFLCLVPVFMGQESLDFRYWEGGLSVVISLIALNMIIGMDRADRTPPTRRLALFAAILSLTFFISPALGLGTALCSLVLALRRWPWPVRLRTGIMAVVALALLLAPWIIRNDQVLGKPILLRSNAPLEFAIANNDAALAPDHGVAFTRAMTDFHPVGEKGGAKVRALGELGYMTELSQANAAWVSSNPGGFVRLALRHVRQMLLPEPFQFELGSGRFSHGRAAIYAVIAILGVIGIAWGMSTGRNGYGYVAIMVGTVILAYAPFQPMARYLYLIYGLLTIAAFDAVFRLAAAVRPPR